MTSWWSPGTRCRPCARRLAHPDVDELFADEFPWFVDEILVALDRLLGFRGLVAEQLSDLSWGVAARRAVSRRQPPPTAPGWPPSA